MELFFAAQEKHLPWSAVVSEALASPQVTERSYIREVPRGDGDGVLPLPGRFYRIGGLSHGPALSREAGQPAASGGKRAPAAPPRPARAPAGR